MAAASTQSSASSSASAINPDERSRLQESFASLPFTSHPSRWDSLYRQAFTPWDRAGPSLALADLLAQRTDLVPPAQERDARGNLVQGVPRRTALVPGCGRGHDVLLLSSFGYDVWGLDYSPDAVRMAEENRKDAESKGLYKPVEEDLEKGDIKWLAGDFFDESWSKGIGTDGSGTFDLIYDYTVSLISAVVQLHVDPVPSATCTSTCRCIGVPANQQPHSSCAPCPRKPVLAGPSAWPTSSTPRVASSASNSQRGSVCLSPARRGVSTPRCTRLSCQLPARRSRTTPMGPLSTSPAPNPARANCIGSASSSRRGHIGRVLLRMAQSWISSPCGHGDTGDVCEAARGLQRMRWQNL